MNEITVIRYDQEQHDRWNAFVQKSKNGVFLFFREFMEYHQDRFEDHSLMFEKDGELAAILPASIKDDVLTSHAGLTYGGFLTDTNTKQHTINECLGALIQYTKEEGIRKIVYKAIPHVFHRQPAEEDLYILHNQGATLRDVCASTVINLKKPLKMTKGRKAQISRAKREGVEIRKTEREEDYREFIELENKVLSERHATHAVHTAEELYLLHSRFPDSIHLYGAFYQTKMIAGTVVFEYEDAIHTQYMASDETGRVIGALDYAVSEVIRDYQDRKTWLDFGISTEDHGTVLNEGLISQKESFGGRTNIYTVWELTTE